VIINAIKSKSRELKCPIHAINAAYDHIHIAVTIPPALAIWQWVRDAKGLSAHLVNRDFPDRNDTFRWQKGYSVHTFGLKTLSFVVDYIERQKEHHHNKTLEDYLEYIPD
jgi:putative transposase